MPTRSVYKKSAKCFETCVMRKTGNSDVNSGLVRDSLFARSRTIPKWTSTWHRKTNYTLLF